MDEYCIANENEYKPIKENFFLQFLPNRLLNKKFTLHCDEILTISKDKPWKKTSLNNFLVKM